jgi:hypothetical protein
LDYAFPKTASIINPDINYAEFTPACNYLWNGNLQIDEKGKIRSICCYMSRIGNREIKKNLGFLRGIEIISVYSIQKVIGIYEDFLVGKCINIWGWHCRVWSLS